MSLSNQLAQRPPGYEHAALVIAHPGHELRIHHWVELVRPVCFVLTDGSGHTGKSRIASTTAVLERAGARRGGVYAAFSDVALYRGLLAGERDMFTQIVVELADALQREGITCVVGDAVEGVNPGHDVCRLLLNAALERIQRGTGLQLTNMEYPVEGPPNECPAEDRAEALFLQLDDAAYQRKVEAARAYPELVQELVRVLGTHAVEAFRVECLRPVRYQFDIGDRFPHPCVYERYGEKQMAAGIYREVIRFRDHITPLAEHLKRFSAAV